MIKQKYVLGTFLNQMSGRNMHINDHNKIAEYIGKIVNETLFIPTKCEVYDALRKDDYDTFHVIISANYNDENEFKIEDYLNSLTDYLNIIYSTILTFSRMDNEDRSLYISFSKKHKIDNKNVDKLIFDTYVVPIINLDPKPIRANGFDITFFNFSWIDYIKEPEENEKIKLNHKWQIFFDPSKPTYKFFVFFKLIEYINLHFTHDNIKIEIKTDVAQVETNLFNRDLIVIYVDDIEPISGSKILNTTNIKNMLKSINLNFDFLRIKKVLFRNGDISRIPDNRNITRDELIPYFNTYICKDSYDNSLSPYNNLMNLKSTFHAEMNDEYNVTKILKRYDEYMNEAKLIFHQHGGTINNYFLILCLFIISLLLIVIIVSITSRPCMMVFNNPFAI